MAQKEVEFNEFYTEVKEIEKRDSVLTSKQQIDRLLRPGSTYFNLNPFEVLQVEPEAEIDAIKKTYRKYSILVHPDKNQNDAERAQQAFEIINRAWKTLENDDTRKKCLDIVEEAKGRTDLMLAEKRKKAKKESKDGIPEDDPEKYKHAVYVLTMKLFADMERKRRELAERDQEERKRKREAEIEEEENLKAQREWQKNFEESRQNRVDSWQTFKAGSSKSKPSSSSTASVATSSTTIKPSSMKSTKKMKMFKPPKNKPESR